MPTETVDFELGLEQTVDETGVHEHVAFGLAMTGGPFSASIPLLNVIFGQSFGMFVREYPHEHVSFGLGLTMDPRSRLRPTVSVDFLWGMEFNGQSTNVPVYETDNPVQPSTVSGVLPQTGSGTGIYPKWVRREIKEVRLNRSADGHESSDMDEDEIRYAWDLSVNISRAALATHWNFVKNKFGMGQAFYFYDLQSNGFIYDPAGVVTTGRYKVRFDTAVIPQVLQMGARFVIDYSLIEVE